MKEGTGARAEFPDISDASNVLLLAPTGDQSLSLCFDALAQSTLSETNVLAVTYTSKPAEWVASWGEHVGGQPASGSLVVVGQSDTEFEDDPWTATAVESPGDLTGIGIELSNSLSGLADSVGPDGSVVACFDSVTALLQYADLQRAFRFLHVVTGRVRNADARCYYRLDPTAHDEQTMATLDGLFDTTVEREDDGWTVR